MAVCCNREAGLLFIVVCTFLSCGEGKDFKLLKLRAQKSKFFYFQSLEL